MRSMFVNILIRGIPSTFSTCTMKKILTLAFAIFQIACVAAQPCSLDSLILRTIKANDTDLNIQWELQNHQVFTNPDCVPNDKLLIHLVGSFDNPARTTFFPTLAANNGYKVIVLKYPNGTAAVSACGNSTDIDCFRRYRHEIVFGVDSSSEVAVGANECILNRVEKLISYLDNTFPDENWDNFLSAPGAIDWSDIVVSGHSQGGGHAAYLGQQFQADRVLMFASPNDYSNHFSAPANWLSLASATQDSNYFAFGNLFDEVVDANKQFANWTAMNLLSQSDSVLTDNSGCDFNNAQVLYTRFDSTGGIARNHSSVVIDEFTPLTAGVPTFTPVWEYMLGLCEGSTSIAVSQDDLRMIHVFPNPVSSSLRVESSDLISSIEIFSTTGKKLLMVEAFQKSVEVNVESYPGLLFLKVTHKGIDNSVWKTVVVR